MTGSMYPVDVFGTNLQGSHPFSLKSPLVDAPDLVPSLVTNGTTADPLKLVKSSMVMWSEPVVIMTGRRLSMFSQNFLVRDSLSAEPRRGH